MAMMATSGLPQPPPISRYGLTQVYAPQGGGLVDVVFVHGLNGDPQRTWTAEKSGIFWPGQLLPPILAEQRARVLVYGYDADVTSFTDGASKDKILNHAEHLVAELAANRRLRRCMERPIIFVAHSLGGLVVKRALIYSEGIRGNYTEHLRSIYVSTYGILFLGTPHKGSAIAEWGSRLEWICGAVLPKKVIDSEPQLVEALKKDNETLQTIDRDFIELISRFHIYFFHESKKTNLHGTLRYIVDEESASPTVQNVERAGIQADHSHMCKFENDGAPGFDLVAEGIQRYAGEAPEKIKPRWVAEMAERDAKKKADFEINYPGSVLTTPHSDSTSTSGPSPDVSQIIPPQKPNQPPQSDAPSIKDDATNTESAKTTEPYFIVPPGFRKNSYFVGMEKEYQELDRRLFDKRRRDGTATVLLHGQPGGGKTHLARQYVFKERKKFAGGIFWITAKSEEERHHAFSNIKQKVVARDCPDKCNGTNGNDYVYIVKEWFETRHDWLIVFDGVGPENDEEVTRLSKFIPDSKDSSIIYVSRAKNLESKERLLRPFAIKVGPLKDEEARKLLFKELHIKIANEAQKAKASELIRKVGGLPLAISAICRRLADTHEPLVKFKLQYSSDPTLEKTYNQILDDLIRLGFEPAWNLVHTLCWFAQDVPVEMVHLGIKALRADVEVKTKEQTGDNADLNNTFGILMRYALIERNEPDDKDPMSSSRDSLTDPEPIDMLKIHSVVQNFCCASLNKRGLLPLWLGYAVKLFCWSYNQADIRIKAKREQRGELGRVSDYRYYKVHGQRLWDHAVSDETKRQSLRSIQGDLQPVLERIDEEIQLREPNSSQESLKEGIFQISIFDRTSSSSESAPSLPGPPTPNYRPTPPPLMDQNMYGFPISKPMDSPRSLGTASPGHPRITNLSPRMPGYDDIGYDSDREGHPHAHPMWQPNLSEGTARPTSRSRAATNESMGEGWQLVPPSRRPRKPRRDLGSFRPAPGGTARARVNRQSVSRAQEDKQPHRRESSPALKSLQKVQSQSPSPPRTGLASLFQRENRQPASDPPRPTWAQMAAGKIGQAVGSNSLTAPNHPPTAPLLDRGRSRESQQNRRGNTQSSPLAAEFKPDDPFYTGPSYGQYPPIGIQYATARPGSSSNIYQLPPNQTLTGPYNDYRPSTLSGPNPAPLPYEEIPSMSMSMSTKRPLPLDLYTTNPNHPSPLPNFYPLPTSSHHSPENRTSPNPHQHPHPDSCANTTTAAYPLPYPPILIPAGYTSQPISRNPSAQTHASSIAETEPPPRYRPAQYSPQFALSYPPEHQNQNQTYSSSPRERYPDGQAFRKSPKTGSAVPVGHYGSVGSASGFELMGGWATGTTNTAGLGGSTSGAAAVAGDAGPSMEMSMSRESSGPGPGIKLAEPAPGAGAQHVQFGAHVPVDVEEARRRVAAYEARLREGAAGGTGGSGAGWPPYPDINLIPTGSDAVVLEEMVGNGDGGGETGRPGEEGRGVGLGVRM